MMTRSQCGLLTKWPSRMSLGAAGPSLTCAETRGDERASSSMSTAPQPTSLGTPFVAAMMGLTQYGFIVSNGIGTSDWSPLTPPPRVSKNHTDLLLDHC